PNWKLILLAIIVVTVVFAVFAYRKEDSLRSAGSNDRSDVTGHIPNLHIAAGSDGKIKDYEGFTVAFNKSNRTPDWVGWELTADEAYGSESRSDNFWCDYALEGCAEPADYRNSGYDRGHLCPAADQKWSPAAMSDCFVMANMTPQDHALNAGAWATLEEKERLWAKRDSAIVIVAGPVYKDSDRKHIGSGVRVPSAFFKVLLAPYLPTPRAIGFIYPNMRAPGNMADYSMSVDRVEAATGLDFFSSLPDSIENIVESHASFTEWNRK
ncbi:MAG: DNA/RNA non-specific endonuclease, partial [Muribaculaceae bacterium]|nr:DNA/RNA non-specific endonuclease [Muribaculaceae bacterium]